MREVEEAGGTPYGIPAGASEHPLGGLGFARWAFEVAEQETAIGVHFDTIVVCTVTGSTHAGMIAGCTGDIPTDSTVLYAHLGGQPAVNAYHRLWDPA